jgi:subtilisin family serine protease
MDRNYQFAKEFSNFGSHVSILAPGDYVQYSSYQDPEHIIDGSGTSFAVPLVAGIMASILSHQGDPWTPRTSRWLLETLKMNSIEGAIEDLPRQTVNRLASTGLNNPNKIA